MRETRGLSTILVGNLVIKVYVEDREVDGRKTYFIKRDSRSGSCSLTGNCFDYELPVSDTVVDYLISQFLSQLIYLFLDSVESHDF